MPDMSPRITMNTPSAPIAILGEVGECLLTKGARRFTPAALFVDGRRFAAQDPEFRRDRVRCHGSVASMPHLGQDRHSCALELRSRDIGVCVGLAVLARELVSMRWVLAAAVFPFALAAHAHDTVPRADRQRHRRHHPVDAGRPNFIATSPIHCARYNKIAVISSVHRRYGDYIGFRCYFPRDYDPRKAFLYGGSEARPGRRRPSS